MRTLLLATSSLSLILGIWAGSIAGPVKEPPGPLIQAKIEARKLSAPDQERILPLIEQALGELRREKERRRIELNVVYVSAFLIGVIGLIGGIRGTRKKA